MNRQGVTTTQKGCCSACDKPIVGQVITALGRTWHPEHFTCSHCCSELGTRNFFERDGNPYCEPDYHNLFSPRCAYCNGAILDVRFEQITIEIEWKKIELIGLFHLYFFFCHLQKCVTALDKTWHTEHFFCAQCGQQFGEDGFHERDGKPYCRNDYFDMFAPKCAGCNRAIMENYISALNSQWHAECFVCRVSHFFYKFFDKFSQNIPIYIIAKKIAWTIWQQFEMDSLVAVWTKWKCVQTLNIVNHFTSFDTFRIVKSQSEVNHSMPWKANQFARHALESKLMNKHTHTEIETVLRKEI